MLCLAAWEEAIDFLVDCEEAILCLVAWEEPTLCLVDCEEASPCDVDGAESCESLYCDSQDLGSFC